MRRWSGTDRRLAVVAAVVCGGLLLSGCRDRESAAPGADAPKSKSLPAEDVLEQMFKTYKSAETYADAGELKWKTIVGGESQSEAPIPFSVSLERPNRIRLHMFGAMIVSDGQKAHATVPYLNQQVLETPAPLELTDSNFAKDPVLVRAITPDRPEFASPQVQLLLGDNPQQALIGDSDPPELLEEKPQGDRPCYRVAVDGEAGRRVFWIDKESFVLRRLDLPTKKLLEEMDPAQGVTDIQAWFELTGAQVGGAIDPEAFRFEIPEGATRLKSFVTQLPDPLPERIGETVGEFNFTDLNGEPVTRESLAGKVVVLDFWTNNCQFCSAALPKLEEVYGKLKDNPQVAILAVNADPTSATNKTVEETIRSWGVSIPVVRDPERRGTAALKVQGFPTTFLLGTDGKIQGYKVGFHPQYDNFDALEESIQRLLAGEDIAEQIQEVHKAQQLAFEQRLAEASVDSGAIIVEVPRAEIAPKSDPQSIQLTQLWVSDQVKAPGTVLAVDGAATPDIYVVDQGRSVVQYGHDGEIVARFDISLPDQTAISMLRTAVDADGVRYFAIVDGSRQKLFLLDDQWKLLWNFPEGRHAGIADVKFADLGGDGQLEILVGYWGQVGVQCVSLEGQRVWSNRTMEHVLQLIVSDADDQGHRQVLVLNSRGTLVPVDHQAKDGPDIHLPGPALIGLFADDVDQDGQLDLCSLRSHGLGRLVAAGIDLKGVQLFRYELPKGEPKYLIEPVVPARLAEGRGGWLLPAADGSIHLLEKDGSLIDRFNYGSELKGLALTRVDDHLLLLVSSSDGLAAWKIEL